jgi:hypothetical protein
MVYQPSYILQGFLEQVPSLKILISPEKSSPYRTSLVPLGINSFDRPLTMHLDSFHPTTPHTGAQGNSKAIWGCPPPPTPFAW